MSHDYYPIGGDHDGPTTDEALEMVPKAWSRGPVTYIDDPKGRQIDGGHYLKCGIQPRVYARANNFNYDECNVLRYLTRHRRKNGAADLEKAIHSLQLLLETEYGRTEGSPET